MNKTVPFKFRGSDLTFDLSQGLFSSAGIDAGTQLLLKAFSNMLDGYAKEGRPLPAKVLDAGCGVGVIGICAAAALSAMGVSADGHEGLSVRCQDRDELARLFTLHNAAKNGVPASVLEAHTEPLLAGPEDVRWDLILSNIPAKAGTPVLEDFVGRSAGLLNLGGRVAIVVVNTLADFFRNRIAFVGAELLLERKGSGHTVFAYSAGEGQERAEPIKDLVFSRSSVFYHSGSVMGEMNRVPMRLMMTTFHGVSGLDGPGAAVQVAAKLVIRLGPEAFIPPGIPAGSTHVLVHEPELGYFPCWLFGGFLLGSFRLRETPRMTLSGRNKIALQASWMNVFSRCDSGSNVTLPAEVPAADLNLGRRALLEATGGTRYAAIFAFPELLPQSSLPKGSDQLAALWDAIPPLLMPGGFLLVALGSSDAERFDRRKPAGFARLGGLKRDGFRALAYRSAHALNLP